MMNTNTYATIDQLCALQAYYDHELSSLITICAVFFTATWCWFCFSYLSRCNRKPSDLRARVEALEFEKSLNPPKQ